jgi:hypothetical protein
MFESKTRGLRPAGSRSRILRMRCHARTPVPDLIGDDPGIHQSSQERFSKQMDCRLKPGNDEVCQATAV